MEVHRVHDADDRRIHGRRFLAERLASRAALQHDEHLLVHARADAVDGQERDAARRVVDVQRLHEEQLRSVELAVFLSRHKRTDDAGDLHRYRSTVQWSTMPTMPASTGGSAG